MQKAKGITYKVIEKKYKDLGYKGWSSCEFADAKRRSGLPVSEAYNRKNKDFTLKKCGDKLPKYQHALRELGILH